MVPNIAEVKEAPNSKKSTIAYIYHHLGLGDHLICNGLVRNIARSHSSIKLVVKKHNLTSVQYMYRDLTKIDFVSVDDDDEANNILFQMEYKHKVYRIGHEHFSATGNKFDISFYSQMNVPFDKRWSDFYVKRDKEKEYDLFKKYDVIENEHIFLHEDRSRQIFVKRDWVKEGLKVVEPDISYTDNLFDYCYLLENAYEIHCMCSSFKHLADSLDLSRVSNLYYHLYPRTTSLFSSSKYPWQELV